MPDDPNVSAPSAAESTEPTSKPAAGEVDQPERLFTGREVEAIVRDRLARVKRVGGEDVEIVFAERLARVRERHAEELAAAVGRAIERTIERLGTSPPSRPSSFAETVEKFYASGIGGPLRLKAQ